MNCVHPKLKSAAAMVALAFLSSAVGCKNQQTPGLANPFLAPNRVPPPSTRTLLPGQAQPYYQGDPLPVTQNGVPPSNAAIAQASAELEMPSAEGNLAWTSPTGPASATNANATPVNNSAVSSPPSSAVVSATEPTVAIPDDGNLLRFALPGADQTEPQQFTPSNPVPLASSPAPNSQQPLQLPSPPSSRNILQAAYTEPVITNSAAPSPSPWRTPQIASANVAPAAQPTGKLLVLNAPPSLPPNYPYTVPTVAATNTMDVRLREVPSPPMPRIRIPGADTSVPYIGSADGFRSRTSMR